MTKIHRAVAPILAAALLAVPLIASPAYATEDKRSSAGVADSNKSKNTKAPVTKVTGGVVRGYVDDDGVMTYKGIPYAASTAGENRWQAPQAVEKWAGIKDTTEFGPSVVQSPPPFVPLGPYTEEYLDVGKSFENGGMSEDSLSLNVWTTAKANADKPVVVFIHGGGNASGSSAVEIYTGEEIAQKDVVYVSINYRVGIFGFLAYQDETGAEVTGNYGYMDQIAALHWVQDNIRKFGGDPSNVTVVGQSAGASNVQTLVASPSAAGLFDHAVAMSGNSIKSPLRTLQEAQDRASAALGSLTLDELRAMSAAEVQALTGTYNPTGAVLDGDIVTQSLNDAYTNGTANPVDLMIGGVDGDRAFGGVLRLPDDDGNPYSPVYSVTPAVYEQAVLTQLGPDLLAAYPVPAGSAPDANVIDVANTVNFDAIIWLAAHNAAVKEANYPEENSYIYHFSHRVPSPTPPTAEDGVFHTGDVSYWLNYYSTTAGRSWTDIDKGLGDAMSDYLVDFAEDGAIIGWPDHDGSEAAVEYMHFVEKDEVATLDANKTALWGEYYSTR